MGKRLSVIMYHYVRELEQSRFPKLKGLSTSEFKCQIGYLKKYYHVISAAEVMDAIQSGNDLPPRAALLTFDDGYIDHFSRVFPVLDQEKLSGCFFPPAKCILESRVLDVNKIHFILACSEDHGQLVRRIEQLLGRHGSSYGVKDMDFYWRKCARANRLDPAEVVFIKRMLQLELPGQLRTIIIDELFNHYVSEDETAFSRELYMSIDQLACLNRNGMYVGSHGFDHHRLNTLSLSEQEREIDLSLKFLREVGSDTRRWMISYPHGAFNESLIAVLRRRNCVAGFTSQIGLADLGRDHPFKLLRLDTNDLPKKEDALPGQWTKEVIHQCFEA